jgi:competence protein ComEC
VLRRFPVGALLDGGDGTGDPAFRALEREADRRGIERIPALAPLDLSLADGDLRIRVLSPPPRPRGPPAEDPNPRAVVAVVSCGGFDLLLSADAESEALLPLDLPDVDAMKVPHHGSADPGIAAELERLRPEVAAVEVGAGNSYGHPAPSTLAALHAAGVRTYRTDRDGTIALMTDGNGMRVETDP